MSAETAHWMRVPILGMPGTECGMMLEPGELTTRRFEPMPECGRESTFICNGVFLCEGHAGELAEYFGDTLEGIRRALRARA